MDYSAEPQILTLDWILVIILNFEIDFYHLIFMDWLIDW